MKTKEKLIRNAIKLFSQKGYERTSVEDIANKTNISKGSFYYHFRSKNHLFFEILETHVNEFERSLNEKLEGVTSSYEKIDVYLNAKYSFMIDNPEVTRMLFSEFWFLKNDFRLKCHKKLQVSNTHIIEQALSKGVENGLFDPDLDINHAAAYIVSSITSSVTILPVYIENQTKEQVFNIMRLSVLGILPPPKN